MKLISVADIIEGMVLERDVMNDSGVVFLSRGTVLNSSHIMGLENFGFDFVYVYGEGEMNKSMIFEDNLNKEFENAIKVYKNLYMNARLGHAIDIVEAKQSITPIISLVTKSNDIMSTLRKVSVEDIYTYRHSINVCLYSSMIAKWLGMSNYDVIDVALCGLLHDIGKSRVSIKIINKADKLSFKEFDEVKKHVDYGLDLLKNDSRLGKKVLDGIYQHHERLDGSGYPLGISGNDISLYPRIIAVADTFDALISDRVYQKKISPYKAIEILKDESFGKLDPQICTVFIKNISDFYVGNIVKLSNGRLGEVILLNKHNINRPLIKSSKTYIDLSTDYSIDIIEVLDSKLG